MTAFVIGDDIEILFRENERSFRADEYLVQGLIKAALCDRIKVTARCQQRCLVDQVCKVCTNHTRSGTGDGNQVNIPG